MSRITYFEAQYSPKQNGLEILGVNQGTIHHNRRYSRFIIMALQGVEIPKQGLDRTFHNLHWHD
jgi:hypothetical protein